MTPSRTLAYVRLTSVESEVEQYKADITQCAQKRGLGQVEWVEEWVSAQVPWRACQIAQVLATLRPGDHLIVSRLWHLGRSLIECLEVLSLALSKGIYIDAVEGDWRLDQPSQSQVLAQCLTLSREIEQALVSQRVKQALAAKKKAGLPLGRPRGSGQSKLDQYGSEIEALLANGSSQKFIAHHYGTTEANLSRWMTKHALKRWQE